MKGDFSRLTFDSAKHYAAVLHQQGRVWLDSDWNEDSLIRLALLDQQAADMIGPFRSPAPGVSDPCCVPAPGAGFAIAPNPDPNAPPDDFLVAAGRCYVNGVRCALEADTSYLRQPDLPSAPRLALPADGTPLTAYVYLEVWRRLITYLEDDAIREVALGGPDTAARLKTVAQVRIAPVPASTPPADVVSENFPKFAPRPGSGTLTTLQPVAPPQDDPCRLPDPANFMGRENRFYRVEIHDGGDVGGGNAPLTVNVNLGQDAKAGATTLVLAKPLSASQVSAVALWSSLVLTGADGVSERAAVSGVSPDGRTVTLSLPLRVDFLLANKPTVTSLARFKWSRDNAAFAVRVSAVSADRRTLTLAHLGRDQTTAFRQGDLVELSNDASELGAARGHLTFLADDPDPDLLTVSVADPVPPELSARGPLVLRRWDGLGTAGVTFSPTSTPDMDLGDGVRIQFGGSDLRPGDYWQFAARTADGSIERLAGAPPRGIARLRSPLAIVQWRRTSAGQFVMTVLQDCRRVFPALIDFPKPEKAMHVVQVLAADSAGSQLTPLLNDSAIVATNFGGLNIVCDTDVDPASISPATCRLQLDIPGSVPIAGYQPVTLAGGVSAAGATIAWRPQPDFAAKLPGILSLKPATDKGILARLTLKGNFIWSRSSPRIFLDGDASGFPQAGISSISLPSGGNRRTGDFETWFWLVAPSLAVAAIQFDKPQVAVGGSATGTVTLSGAATSEGVAVALSTDAAGLVSFPAVVSVPFGSSSATFKIAAGARSGPAVITASLGGIAKSPALVVSPRIRALALDTPQTTPGGKSRATAVLEDAAAAGAVIALSSDNPSVAAVPATAAVAAGASSVTFELTIGASGGANITATVDTSSASATLTATGALVGIEFQPATVLPGSATKARITLSAAAPAGGLVVALSSDKSNVAAVPANVTVPPGSTTASIDLVAGTAGSATVTASAGGISKTAALGVVTLSDLKISSGSGLGDNVTAGSGAFIAVIATLTGKAPQSGFAVDLKVDNPDLLNPRLPAQITIRGTDSATAASSAAGIPTNQKLATKITATLGSVSKTVTLTVDGGK